MFLQLLLNVSAANFSGIGPRELWLARQSRWPLGRRNDFRKIVTQMPDLGPPRPYTVRLYFSQPDAADTGRCDVRIQGELVLEDFDLKDETAGTAVGVVKTFHDIPLTERLTVELTPKTNDTAVPMLCGLEVIDE